MQPELKSLLDLQERDRRVMAAEGNLEALNPELDKLDREVADLQAEVDSARQRAAAAVERREALEGKIESYRVMQERRRQRLEWVRGAKEASTLMAEIDLARSVLAKEESEWIRSADEVQKADDTVKELSQRLSELTEQQSSRREEIAAMRSEYQTELDAAKAARNESTTAVKREMLLQYERIRKGRAPLALYPLHGGACGHCFTAVPLHLRQQIEQNRSAAICEACGVMIYLDQ